MALTATRQLSPGELEALAALEKRAVSVDGGRLKLEWGVLRSRSGNITRDFVWRENGELLGFLGLYAFGQAKVEIAGMVDPAARRRGIATALLDAALPLCREYGSDSVLLVVPRGSIAGGALARSRGATLEHSEHALRLDQAPPEQPDDPLIRLREATREDFEVLSALFSSGFGHPLSDPEEIDRSARSRTMMVEYGNQAIGTVRLSKDADQGGVYGFTINPEMRGQGVGREVLRRICRGLFAEGMSQVGLEVEVENDHALGLYLSLGFQRLTTEDYYELWLV